RLEPRRMSGLHGTPECFGRRSAATDLAVRAIPQHEPDQRDLDILEWKAVGSARRGIAQALHRRLDDVVGKERHRRQRALELHPAAPRTVADLAGRLAVDRLLLAGRRHRALEHGVALTLGEDRLAIHDLRL